MFRNVYCIMYGNLHFNIAPDVMNIFEKKKISYNLKNNAHFTKRNSKSAYHDSETIYLGPKI